MKRLDLLLLHFHFLKYFANGVGASGKFPWTLLVCTTHSISCITNYQSFVGNTNGSNYEVYALLGEVYGSGCPLGYLLLHSDGESGGKERFITELLSHFNEKWDIKAIITLTDKDFSEINAFLAVYPNAKHQLCFWHCLRAIKTRLSILRRRPKFYHALEAKKEFDWIDENFVPVAQSKEPNPVKYFYLYNFDHRTYQ